MYTSYEKVRYNNFPGFRINHTTGLDASSSTSQHPHLCAEYLAFYFIHGSGSIKIEGHEYPIHAGDVIFINPSELFHCSVDPSSYHERIVLHISERFLNPFPCNPTPLFSIFTNREKGTGNRIPAEAVESSGLGKKFLQLLKLIQESSSFQEILAVCTVAELLCLLNELSGVACSSTEQPPRNQLIDQVLLYLNENFTQNITIDSVAACFNVTASYLAHLFKEHTGLSPWNYVILRRLHLFNALIRESASMEDACYQAGFDNYSNFFRLYKKYMGMTPSQFKQQLG